MSMTDLPPGHPMAGGPGLGSFMPEDAEIPDGPIRSGQPLADGVEAASEEAIVEALKSVYDPEIPVNIHDLGLIYEIERFDDGTVKIEMTLTAPGCPVAGILPKQVADAVAAVEGVGEVEVNLVWSPIWHPGLMSEEAKLALDMF